MITYRYPINVKYSDLIKIKGVSRKHDTELSAAMSSCSTTFFSGELDNYNSITRNTKKNINDIQTLLNNLTSYINNSINEIDDIEENNLVVLRRIMDDINSLINVEQPIPDTKPESGVIIQTPEEAPEPKKLSQTFNYYAGQIAGVDNDDGTTTLYDSNGNQATINTSSDGFTPQIKISQDDIKDVGDMENFLDSIGIRKKTDNIEHTYNSKGSLESNYNNETGMVTHYEDNRLANTINSEGSTVNDFQYNENDTPPTEISIKSNNNDNNIEYTYDSKGSLESNYNNETGMVTHYENNRLTNTINSEGSTVNDFQYNENDTPPTEISLKSNNNEENNFYSSYNDDNIEYTYNSNGFIEKAYNKDTGIVTYYEGGHPVNTVNINEMNR